MVERDPVEICLKCRRLFDVSDGRVLYEMPSSEDIASACANLCRECLEEDAKKIWGANA